MFKGKKKYIYLALGALLFTPKLINVQAQVEKGRWELKDNKWKYYNEKNELQKGWLDIKGDWYYLDKNTGEMLTGWQNIDGSIYYFDNKNEGVEGRMHTAWYKAPDGSWYFFNNDKTSPKLGIVRSGWQWVDGYCYYFDTNPREIGKMHLGKVGDYLLNASGQWTDVSGKVEYIAGKGFNTKTTATVGVAKEKKSLSRVGSGGGGGRSSGGFGSGSVQNIRPENQKNEDTIKEQNKSEEPSIPKQEEPSVPKQEEPSIPKQEEPSIPKQEEPSVPKQEEPSVPKQEEPSVPKQEEPSVPKQEEPSIPKQEEPSIPKQEEPSVPKQEEPSVPKQEEPNVPEEERKEPEVEKEENENVPARVEIWDNDKKLKDLSIDEEKFEKDNAHYRFYNIELPHEYSRLANSLTKFPNNALTVKVFNKKEKPLDISVQGAIYNTLNIKLNDYTDKRFTSAEISVRFSFAEAGEEESTKDEQNNMDSLSVVVDGIAHKYYYKQYDKANPDEVLKVGGVDVTEKAIKIMNFRTPIAYYYVEDAEKLSGNIYGRATVTAADFYAAELNKYIIFPRDEEPSISLDNFIVSGYVRNYTDVERRKTMENYGAFANAHYEKFKSEEGYFINGIKVPVQVDATLYAKAMIISKLSKLEKPGFVAKGRLVPIAESLTSSDELLDSGNPEQMPRTLTSREPKAYKKLYGNGVLSPLMYSENAGEISATNVKAVFTDQSDDPRFDYEINLENLPEEIRVKENVLGVVMTQEDERAHFGFMFDENIDIGGNRLKFSVHRRETGSGTHYARYSTRPSIIGKKIKRIIYLLTDNKQFVIDNLSLYVPKQLPVSSNVKVVKVDDFSVGVGANVKFDISTLPYKDNAKVDFVYKVDGDNKTKLVLDADYSYDEINHTISIKDTANTGAGSYRIIFKDGNENGYISIANDFEIAAKPNEDSESSGMDTGNIVSVGGEEEVVELEPEEGEEATDYNYKAKVLVTYDKSTGNIIKVEDKTVPDNASKSYWRKITKAKFFDKLVGKNKDNIDSVDAVSQATCSRVAIIKAVKKALNGDSATVAPTENTGKESKIAEADNPQTLSANTRTLTGKAQVDQWGYKAQISVTYDIDTGRILSVKDNDTNCGAHKPYWSSAKTMMKSFVGKKGTKEDIESVDSISGATYSSRGIKDAMRDAFNIDDDALTSEGHF